jgi:hypothetical protein
MSGPFPETGTFGLSAFPTCNSGAGSAQTTIAEAPPTKQTPNLDAAESDIKKAIALEAKAESANSHRPRSISALHTDLRRATTLLSNAKVAVANSKIDGEINEGLRSSITGTIGLAELQDEGAIKAPPHATERVKGLLKSASVDKTRALKTIEFAKGHQ